MTSIYISVVAHLDNVPDGNNDKTIQNIQLYMLIIFAYAETTSPATRARLLLHIRDRENRLRRTTTWRTAVDRRHAFHPENLWKENDRKIMIIAVHKTNINKLHRTNTHCIIKKSKSNIKIYQRVNFARFFHFLNYACSMFKKRFLHDMLVNTLIVLILPTARRGVRIFRCHFSIQVKRMYNNNYLWLNFRIIKAVQKFYSDSL